MVMTDKKRFDLFSSYVNVAKWSTRRPQCILVLDRRCQRAHDDRIRQLPRRAVDRVQGRRAAGEGTLSVLGILVLPDPPCAVDLCVMEEESRLGWRSEKIAAWVAACREVAGSVDAVESAGEIALHAVLE